MNDNRFKADLSVEFCGVRAPNPFWLASGPPTNTAGQVLRAFEAGWGGAVWKTITDQPIVNVSSRYASFDYDGHKVMGLNNIELISDRTLDDNLAEIARVKRAFPDRALFVSLMVETRRDRWHEIVKQAQGTGADGIELNLGCPHGMNERGMGSAVGQVPEYTRMVTEWCKEAASVPVMVKLTPNVTDIRAIGRAAKQGGADAISLINTVNSIMGVNLHTMAPRPDVAGEGTHGGYSGPAIKPIALHMVQRIASDPEIDLPVSGVGGIRGWCDAAEHMLLGADGVQVCTAVMHYGFRIIGGLCDGLQSWMQEHAFRRCTEFVGRTLPRMKEWSELDLDYRTVARIDQSKCIGCDLCYVSCEDGCYQAVVRDPQAAAVAETGGDGQAHCGAEMPSQSPYVYRINEEACVGCNMCALVCPVEQCIEMVPIDTGRPSMSWNDLQMTVRTTLAEHR